MTIMSRALRFTIVLAATLTPCLMADDHHTSLDDRFTVEGCYKAAKHKAQAAQDALERKYAQREAIERYVQDALASRNRNPLTASRHPLLAKAYRAKQARAAKLCQLLRTKQQSMNSTTDPGEISKLKFEIRDIWIQLRNIYRELVDNTTNTECVTALLRNLARAELNVRGMP